MTLLRNLALFFVLFLPASCVTGVVSGFLSGPMPAPRSGYALMTFVSSVLPLLLPSLLAVPLLHFAYRRWLRAQPTGRARWLAMLLTPLALLGLHLGFYGDPFWSVPLVAMVVVPGIAYGAVFGLVRETMPPGG